MLLETNFSSVRGRKSQIMLSASQIHIHVGWIINLEVNTYHRKFYRCNLPLQETWCPVTHRLYKYLGTSLNQKNKKNAFTSIYLHFFSFNLSSPKYGSEGNRIEKAIFECFFSNTLYYHWKSNTKLMPQSSIPCTINSLQVTLKAQLSNQDSYI